MFRSLARVDCPQRVPTVDKNGGRIVLRGPVAAPMLGLLDCGQRPPSFQAVGLMTWKIFPVSSEAAVRGFEVYHLKPRLSGIPVVSGKIRTSYGHAPEFRLRLHDARGDGRWAFGKVKVTRKENRGELA